MYLPTNYSLYKLFTSLQYEMQECSKIISTNTGALINWIEALDSRARSALAARRLLCSGPKQRYFAVVFTQPCLNCLLTCSTRRGGTRNAHYPNGLLFRLTQHIVKPDLARSSL